MTKKKIYVTSSLLLASIVVPAIATFTYINLNIKPGVEIQVLNLKDKIYGYESNVKLGVNLTRISTEHNLEYSWYQQINNGEFKPLNNNESEITVKYNGIGEVRYKVSVKDTDNNNKEYFAEHVIKYEQPILYIKATTNGNDLNIFDDKITTNDPIELKPEIKKDLLESLIFNDWFIEKNDKKILTITELLKNDQELKSILEIKEVNGVKILSILKPQDLIKYLNKNRYQIKYWCSNTNNNYQVYLELK